MGFSPQGYWNGFLFTSPVDLPDVGIEPGSPTLLADALPSEPPGKHQPFTRIGNIWVNPDLSFTLPFFCSALMASATHPIDTPPLYFSFTPFLSGWLAPSFPPALQRNTNTALAVYQVPMCINPVNLHHTTVRDFIVISHVRKMRLSEVKRFSKLSHRCHSAGTRAGNSLIISSHSWIPPLPPMLVFIWCSSLIY